MPTRLGSMRMFPITIAQQWAGLSRPSLVSPAFDDGVNGIDGAASREGQAGTVRQAGGRRRSCANLFSSLHEGGTRCCGVTVKAIVVRGWRRASTGRGMRVRMRVGVSMGVSMGGGAITDRLRGDMGLQSRRCGVVEQ